MQMFLDKLPCRYELMKINGLGNGLFEICEGPKDAGRVQNYLEGLFERCVAK